jgi:hypothetical protein
MWIYIVYWAGGGSGYAIMHSCVGRGRCTQLRDDSPTHLSTCLQLHVQPVTE